MTLNIQRPLYTSTSALEWHRFEVPGSTYMQTFVSKYTMGPVSLGFASSDTTNSKSKTWFSIHSWESMDAEGQLYTLLYIILYEGLHCSTVNCILMSPLPLRFSSCKSSLSRLGTNKSKSLHSKQRSRSRRYSFRRHCFMPSPITPHNSPAGL